MGVVEITLRGSFVQRGVMRAQSFSAMQGGHAKAVADAIAWLAGDVMAEAVANDHRCQKDGVEPSAGFGCKGKILPTQSPGFTIPDDDPVLDRPDGT